MGAAGAAVVAAAAAVVAAAAAGVEEADAYCVFFLFLEETFPDHRSPEEDMKMGRGTKNVVACAPVWHRHLLMVLVVCLTFMGAVGSAIGAAARQKSFPSPEAGVQALIEAVQKHDTKTLLEILGPAAQSLINSGDPVADRESGARFVQAYEAAHTLVPSGDTKVVLQTGPDAWPFPIPLVKDKAGWRFDTPAGKEEILNRRIGRNELDVIQVCLAYVDAQREYYQRNPLGEPLLHYAARLISTPGKRDGLYWDTQADEAPSPFGPLVARARGQGYKGEAGKPAPYHGYYYKILTGQGPAAPDGAYDYMVRGKMIGGFALLAYPAQYGASGITTFMVNHDGVVYEKDLGPNTTATAQSIKQFNPDKTWKKSEPSD
jgi:hypothetical protein